MDAFVLLHFRTGVVYEGHSGCDGGDERFHLQACDRFGEGHPSGGIFDDKHIPDWKK